MKNKQESFLPHLAKRVWMYEPDIWKAIIKEEGF